MRESEYEQMKEAARKCSFHGLCFSLTAAFFVATAPWPLFRFIAMVAGAMGLGIQFGVMYLGFMIIDPHRKRD